MLHRRDEEHGRLGDAHGEAEDDHGDAWPADEAHGVADDMLRGFGYFLEVHGQTVAIDSSPGPVVPLFTVSRTEHHEKFPAPSNSDKAITHAAIESRDVALSRSACS